MNDERPYSTLERFAYFVGATIQGLVLGILVSYAFFELWAIADGVQLFRYQGF